MNKLRATMLRKSVVAQFTPRQAMTALDFLNRTANTAPGPTAARLFSAGHALFQALIEDGWEEFDIGTDDAPRWVWQKRIPV